MHIQSKINLKSRFVTIQTGMSVAGDSIPYGAIRKTFTSWMQGLDGGVDYER